MPGQERTESQCGRCRPHPGNARIFLFSHAGTCPTSRIFSLAEPPSHERILWCRQRVHEVRKPSLCWAPPQAPEKREMREMTPGLLICAFCKNSSFCQILVTGFDSVRIPPARGCAARQSLFLDPAGIGCNNLNVRLFLTRSLKWTGNQSCQSFLLRRFLRQAAHRRPSKAM